MEEEENCLGFIFLRELNRRSCNVLKDVRGKGVEEEIGCQNEVGMAKTPNPHRHRK